MLYSICDDDDGGGGDDEDDDGGVDDDDGYCADDDGGYDCRDDMIGDDDYDDDDPQHGFFFHFFISCYWSRSLSRQDVRLHGDALGGSHARVQKRPGQQIRPLSHGELHPREKCLPKVVPYSF